MALIQWIWINTSKISHFVKYAVYSCPEFYFENAQADGIENNLGSSVN